MEKVTDPKSRPRPRSRVRRAFVGGLKVLGAIYLGITIMLAVLQRALIYGPLKAPADVAQAGLSPDDVQDVFVAAADGIKLHGWLVRTADDEVPTEQRRLVMIFPGNAGNRMYRGGMIRDFNSLGCDALIVDYRGYGENEGQPSESAFAADALAVWKHATENLGYTAGRIVLCGESLGGGVATRLAWDLHQQHVTPAGLILRTTFSSLADAGAYHYPWLPVRLVLIDRYPSIDRIGALTCPILVIHGKQDRIVPFRQAEALFAAAPEKSVGGVPKAFLTLPHAGHNDVQQVASREVHAAHEAFLQQVFPATVRESAGHAAASDFDIDFKRL